jgi:outer membrane immunogenic protein
MKRVFVACSVVCALVSPSIAADIAVPGLYAPVPLRPLYSWTGCHVGFNIGGGASQKSWVGTDNTFPFAPATPATFSVLGQLATQAISSQPGQGGGTPGASLGEHTARGVVGGWEAGCDYQAGAWVFGLQGLYDLTGMKGNNGQTGGQFVGIAFPLPANIAPPATGLSGGQLLDNSFVQTLVTITGRVGYAVQPTMLVYGKAGIAWAHDLYSVSVSSGVAGLPIQSANGLNNGTIIALGAKTVPGWTLGLGYEWAFFGGDWSAFVEYDYAHFGSSGVSFVFTTLFPNQNQPAAATPAPPFGVDISQSVHVALFGMKYRFWGGPRF